MLRNVIIVLVLLTLSATLAAAATSAHHRSSAGLRAKSRYPDAGLHHRAAAHLSPHPAARRAAAPVRTTHRSARVRRSAHTPSSRHIATRAAQRYVSTARPRVVSRRLTRTVDASASPAAEPASYRRTRFVPMPAPLRGSLASLERQNEITEAEGLQRILDDDDLNDRIADHSLVPLPASGSLMVNSELPENRRYCRPWTARFLTDFARAHAARFGRPLMVSSAVRTVEYQRHLILVNGNAAAAEGDIVSPHLTGATIDIAKGTMTRQEVGWVRAWLLRLQNAGKIDVEEEFQQACFHITVYKTYVPSRRAPSPVHRHPKPPLDSELASRGR